MLCSADGKATCAIRRTYCLGLRSVLGKMPNRHKHFTRRGGYGLGRAGLTWKGQLWDRGGERRIRGTGATKKS